MYTAQESRIPIFISYFLNIGELFHRIKLKIRSQIHIQRKTMNHQINTLNAFYCKTHSLKSQLLFDDF